ncbi:MAG: hypothetical protein KAX55_04500 [Propionivibrio sp.]|uniref:transposase DNA-binding-containing protein n=1 Tax=Pseudomonadota TaxID=1224 RepID=UPI000A74E7B7|nr:MULTISPECIES: transposase DNA-binding-containing protein [Pseudomonadota]EKW5506268.1 hypothetical protein [Pseudomonas aeruginosa]EKW5579000.1 hypothetical protein [Pseudomonas aeruginosa]MBP8276133.1 hypothetical protein [Propionivibrio sp.]HEK4046188.1 hypothetical protein [Pseudomonas aeruginosa]
MNERLEGRAALLAERLVGKPIIESIPNACSSWAEMQGKLSVLVQRQDQLAGVPQVALNLQRRLTMNPNSCSRYQAS